MDDPSTLARGMSTSFMDSAGEDEDEDEDEDIDDNITYSEGMLPDSIRGSAFLPYRQSTTEQEAKNAWLVDERTRHLVNIGEVDSLDGAGNESQMFEPHPPTPDAESITGSSASLSAGSRLTADSKAAGDTTFTSLYLEAGGRLLFPDSDDMRGRRGATSTSTVGAIYDGEDHGIYGEYDDQGTDDDRDEESEGDHMDMDAASQES